MINIGIICPSEIALRRFLPALSKLSDFKFIGVAVANKNEWESSTKEILSKEISKAESFVNSYGGKIFEGYASLIKSDEIDAIYLPLPPSLHFKWSKLSLENNKHVFIEKPATTNFKNTQELISLAKNKNLALHENYMFAFHNQIQQINNLVKNDEIGDVRLFRISFGFPQRDINDFRYNKSLGGGALLDCGGYTIKYASMLLGNSVRIKHAQSNFTNKFDVDLYGSATLVNDFGHTVQIAFGMDNNYKCELEIWGSKGTLSTDRVLTAPDGFAPVIIIKNNNETKTIKLKPDDAFMKSIQHFKSCIENDSVRFDNYSIITKQAKLIDEFNIIAKINVHE